ncbi:hypothetical protein FOCC_FOCC001513 [Frankliniella occidentalis]|nr:hypothetical protein FOCC_FOCC001513 [Frankliniella occidentalis]
MSRSSVQLQPDAQSSFDSRLPCTVAAPHTHAPPISLLFISHVVLKTYVSMRKKVVAFNVTEKFLPTVRLTKNLSTKKGSRRGNAGNRLEFTVLTQLQHVP